MTSQDCGNLKVLGYGGSNAIKLVLHLGEPTIRYHLSKVGSFRRETQVFSSESSLCLEQSMGAE